jgi:hypothetical protein
MVGVKPCTGARSTIATGDYPIGWRFHRLDSARGRGRQGVLQDREENGQILTIVTPPCSCTRPASPLLSTGAGLENNNQRESGPTRIESQRKPAHHHPDISFSTEGRRSNRNDRTQTTLDPQREPGVSDERRASSPR